MIKFLTTALLVLVASAVLTLPARADELPRYRLEVGQELTFVAENRIERLKARSKNETVTWTVWVIAKAGDDGWKLIVRRDYSARYTDPSVAGITVNNSKIDPVELGIDGRLLLDSTLGLDPNLFDGVRTCLPLLPKDQVQVQKGYDETSETSGLRYRVVKKEGPWEIAAASQGFLSEIYDIDSMTTYTFDAARGLPVQATMKWEETGYWKTKFQGALRLESVKDHDAAWVAQASVEAKRYFAARRLLDQAYQDGKSDSMKRAEEALKSVQGRQPKSELFQKHVETDLKNLEQEIKERESGECDTAFLGKTVDWTTTDIDGKKVNLADFKGKVVVLDYWYRNCFWCVRSMPQLNEVAEHYKGKSVAVLGMNLDDDEADARFVIKKMNLQYPTLKVGSTRQEYGVNAYPTILILNDKGTVCDVHTGYAPDLKETLIKKIDILLNERK